MPPWSFGISEEILELLRSTFVVNTENLHMLKTKPAVRTAAKTVTAAATGGVVLVHSVKDRSALSSLTASAVSQGKGEFACTSCKTHIVASSHAAPSCTTCGGTTEKVKATAKPSYKGLVAIRCNHCDSVHLMEPNVIKASGHKVHCAVCGGVNSYKPEVIASAAKLFTAEAAPEETPAEDVTADDAKDWPFAGVEAAGDDASEEITASGEDEWPEFTEDTEAAAGDDVEVTFEDVPEPTAAASEEETTTETEAASEDLDLQTDPAVESASDEEAPAEDVDVEDVGDDLGDDLAVELEDLDDTGEIPTDADQDPVAEEATEEEILFTEESAADEDLYEVPDSPDGELLADSLGLDDTDTGLSFQATAGRLVAMKGHVAIASLKREDAGPNADIMMTSSFAAAVKHAARSGMRKALVSAGFTPIRIQSLSKASVARKVQEVQQASANSVAKKLATFSDSLALAAAGLARGSWKGKQNPLKAAFVAAFAQFGVKNPERVVAKILADNSVNYARSMVELATELNSMSPATRKETARILELTEVVASAEEEETDDQDVVVEASDVAGRLRTTAAVLPSVLSQTVAISKQDASQQAVHARATSRALDILDGNSPLNTLG